MEANRKPSIVLFNLPGDVVQTILSSFLDLSDIVELDSSVLVHGYRKSFQQLYRGMSVTHRAILNVDMLTANWLLTRAVSICKINIRRDAVDKWSTSLDVITRNVTDVRFESGNSRTSGTILALLGNCRQLQSVSVRGCTLDDGVLKALMSSCPLLQHVDLSLTNISSSLIAPLLSPRILSLDLTQCTRIEDSIIAVTRACTNLQSIALDKINFCTEASLDAIAAYCPQLRAFSVQKWRFPPEFSLVAIAAGCRDLRSLHFGLGTTLRSTAVRAFATHCKHLVDISITQCNRFGAGAMVALVSSSPQLLTAVIPADDSVLVALVPHCPLLSELRIQHSLGDNVEMRSADFSGEPIAVLLRNCKNLKSLTMLHAFGKLPPPSDGVTSAVETLSISAFSLHHAEEIMCSLLRYMPLLRELHLFDSNKNLGDTVVLAVADHCPLLERISLTGLERLTDLSVIALAQRCPLLRKIDLSGCTLLTDAAVIAIAQHCPQLTHLNLHNPETIQLSPSPITSFVAMGVGGWIAPCNDPLLDAVYVAPDTSISDASITALAAHSHRLRELDTQGHAHVSQAALDALAAALPRCAVNKTQHSH